MKREEVKTKIPGITDEQLDWLMGENGRDITAEKTKAANLQTQVNDLTTQLNTAKDGLKTFEGVDVADLKGRSPSCRASWPTRPTVLPLIPPWTAQSATRTGAM